MLLTESAWAGPITSETGTLMGLLAAPAITMVMVPLYDPVLRLAPLTATLKEPGVVPELLPEIESQPLHG